MTEGKAVEPSGPFVERSREDIVLREGHYENGVPVGLWRESYPNGEKRSETLHDASGKIVRSIEWAHGGAVYREIKPSGETFTYAADGGVTERQTRDGLLEWWHPNGAKAREQRRVGNQLQLLNAWTLDGTQTIRNGDGSEIQRDGELDFPMLVTYRGGYIVRRELPPSGEDAGLRER